MTRVMVVDDHTLVRSGLRRILAGAGITVVAEASSGEAALASLVEANPDVVLMDLMMPGMGGLEAARRARQMLPATAVLMLTVEDDVAFLREAFAAGASGYLIKDAADEELFAAIAAVAAGRQYVHPRLGAALAARPAAAETLAGPGGALSPRECEVLRELALGLTNAEVAERLFLSVRTVENHRAHIFQKLGVSTRADLVRKAVEAGLLRPDLGRSE